MSDFMGNLRRTDMCGGFRIGDAGKEITVRLAGGILTVNYDGENVLLTGPVTQVFTGEFEY